MFRGLIYGSYKKPRELVWIFGSLIFLALMAEAFMGYLLPWGQMSFWGAQVIINLFSAIPVIGPDLSTWIRGDFNVSDVTLNRFFALHVIAVPLVLLGLVVAHITPCTKWVLTTLTALKSRKTKMKTVSRATVSHSILTTPLKTSWVSLYS